MSQNITYVTYFGKNIDEVLLKCINTSFSVVSFEYLASIHSALRLFLST